MIALLSTIAVFLLSASTIMLALGVLAWLADRNTPQPVPTPEPARDVCDLENCQRPSRVVFNAGTLDGRLYICEGHAPKVSEWAPVIGILVPFDQEAS